MSYVTCLQWTSDTAMSCTVAPGTGNLRVVELTVFRRCVLQCVAVCCSVLQCTAVCFSVLQCVVVCCSVLQCVAVCSSVLQCVAVCCSVLQCAAVGCSVLQCVAVAPGTGNLRVVELRVFHRCMCVAARCSALQCVLLAVATCVSMRSRCFAGASVLQCVAVWL